MGTKCQCSAGVLTSGDCESAENCPEVFRSTSVQKSPLMTKAGIAAPKANSQAYPVDVILPSRLLSPSWVCPLRKERPLPKTTSSGLSFLRWRTMRVKKGPRCCPSLGPRTALCASLKRKGPPIAYTRNWPLATNRAFSRGVRGARFMETNSVGSNWFQDGKRNFSCYIVRHVA